MLNKSMADMGQVVKTKPPNSFFVSTIGDFAQDQTVFSKSTATHWKPVMLISQERLAVEIGVDLWRLWVGGGVSCAFPTRNYTHLVSFDRQKMGQISQGRLGRPAIQAIGSASYPHLILTTGIQNLCPFHPCCPSNRIHASHPPLLSE